MTRKVTVDDMNSVIRALHMNSMSKEKLQEHIDMFKDNDAFASRAITAAARHVMRGKQRVGLFSKNPRPSRFRMRGYSPKMKRVIRRVGRRIYGKTYGHPKKPTTNATILARYHRSLKRAEAAHYRKNPSDILAGKSIQTEYFGPTNVRGARIKASVIDGNRIQASISISYPHELDMYAAHISAAEKMRDKMGWSGDLTGVQTRKGYVFGFANMKTSRYGFKRNPRERTALTHKGMLCLQEKRDNGWFTLATFKPALKSMAVKIGKRLHRRYPTRTFRLYS